jgi:hypothetical protein
MKMSTLIKASQDYLRDSGIRHQITVSITPEKNEVAQHMSITTVKKARSMLKDAELSKKYGAEVTKTAMYFKKCCPPEQYKNHSRVFMDRTKIRP